MENKEFQQLTAMLAASDEHVRRVTIGDEAFEQLTPDQAGELVARFGANTLITLPRREREFFAWLRQEDLAVWQDLWGRDADDEQEGYEVSLSFLPELLPRRRGFLICDLVDHQNLYFTSDSITDEGRVYLDAALDIVHANGRLAMEQAFVVEAWRAPIDQWRFAYNYGLPLDEVRRMVLWLIAEGILLLPPTESAEPSSDAERGEPS